VTVRERLQVRRDPYWQELTRGRHIGFRRISATTSGSWLARYYDDETRKYHQRPLGDLASLLPDQRFGEAKRLAEEWFAHLDVGGVAGGTETVKDACKDYADRLRREKSERAAKDAEGSFARLVNDDPIGKVELTKLKPRDFDQWRKRILDRGSKTYFNRNLTPLRAAMNYAYARRVVSSDFAWKEALKPLDVDAAEGRRTLYLTATQRQALIEKAGDELKPLLKAWALLPVRPGEIANIRVADLDVRHRVLKVSGKTGSRSIPLTDAALEHFKDCAKDKLPSAWLIARADGRQWDRFAWRELVKEAVTAAELPKATVAYTLRHSVITDLVTAGVDLFTVARLAGTSIAMIDKHYGQLQQQHAREALEKISI
jgi:integrase